MTIPGSTTAVATAAYSKNHPQLTYLPIANTGWLVSQAGFGGYRVDVSVDTHHQALRRALLNGINLVDTSSNYADGGSEQLIGAVIAEMIDKGELTRESVVIVSKVGYLQGQNYQISQQRKAAGDPFPDLVEYDQGLEHCLHPDFLADQLSRSLQRLNMDSIDCYLLHNPEYYLSWAKKRAIPLNEARDEYYRRITLAFRHLEEEVSNGRIQSYGISSNTFPNPADDAEFTSLEHVWQVAQSVGDDHHFRVIQLPMNLFETGGVTEKNQPDGQSVIEFARDKGLALLINRPLNAISDHHLVRLADVPAAEPVTEQEVSTAVDTLKRAEQAWREDILPALKLENKVERRLIDFLSAGHLLEPRWRLFASYQNWQEIRYQYLVPRVEAAVDFLSNEVNLPPEAAAWLQGYVAAFHSLLLAVDAFYAATAVAQTAVIKEGVVAADPEWGEATNLSQMSIRALRTTQGVTAVLVGMRHPEYVDDVLAELSHPIERKTRETSWAALP